jgi:hypothetical protein
MTLTLAVEIALTALLAATLGYCIVLERRLRALRNGQDGLKSTIAALNTAIAGAGTAMRTLKASAGQTIETMEDRLSRARNLVDELSVLCSSGERIAERFERQSSPARGAAAEPDAAPAAAIMAKRLDALRAVR